MFLFMILIDSLSGFMVLLPMVLLYQYWNIKSYSLSCVQFSITRKITTYLFCYLLIGILTLTGIPSITSIRMDANININMAPFQDVIYNYLQYAENLILFVPFGLLLPLLWEKYSKFLVTTLLGFCLSVTIEVMQLLCYRATDIDDLLMNTLGTIVGYFLFWAVKKMFPKLLEACRIGETHGLKYELCIYLTLAWGAMFFIQPLIVGKFWSLVL